MSETKQKSKTPRELRIRAKSALVKSLTKRMQYGRGGQLAEKIGVPYTVLYDLRKHGMGTPTLIKKVEKVLKAA